jgi:tetratricopeptide (TPR) repeat protein
MVEPLPGPSDETVELSEAALAGRGPSSSSAGVDVFSETVQEGSSTSASDAGITWTSERYQVVCELGRGGMGIVLEALDTRLNRRVALKVLLAGDFASPEALERFQVEARSAARLSHRNLVSVHEVGEEGGRQFLVMDYVEGESLAARLKREGPLDPRDAAWFALRLADALYYAHTRSILHRDVKPANVLLDHEGEPLLTDFGLAKELDGTGPDLTASGYVVGTPAYMSPEQAQGSSDELDRRSDIYALGATLYEMLTGKPPFVAPNMAVLLRSVIEKEPQPVRSLRPEIDADLETICLKCLEKEPALRYPSARGLQEDLERYLAHESILARPPGPVERGRKWLYRNSLLARTLLVTLALCFVAMGVLTVLFVRRLQHQRAVAVASSQEAQRALDVLVFQVRDKLSDLPGEKVRQVRRELLREALHTLMRFAEPGSAVTLRTATALRQLARLALEAGEIQVAKDTSQRALKASREGGTTDDPRVRRNVAISLVVCCEVAQRSSDVVGALEAIDEAVDLLRPLAQIPNEEPHEALLAYLNALLHKIDLLREQGQLKEALELSREAAAGAGRMPRDVAVLERSAIHDALGKALEREGDLKGASEAYKRGIEQARIAVRADPTSVRARIFLLASYDHLVRLRRTLGDLEGSLLAAREGLKLGDALRSEDPESMTTRRHLVSLRVQLSDSLDAVGHLDDALKPLKVALRDCRALLQGDASDGEGRLYLAGILDRLGGLETRRGEVESAKRYQKEHLEVATESAKRDPASKRAQRMLATAIERQAAMLARRGELEPARKGYLRVLEIRRGLGDDRDTLLEVSSVYVHLGELFDRQGALSESSAQFAQAVETRRKLHAREPSDMEAHHGLALALSKLGSIQRRLGEVEAARASLSESERQVRELLSAAPRHADASRLLATVLVHQGDLERSAKKPASARANFEAAIKLRRKLLKESPQDRALARALEISLSRIADLQLAEGQEDAARAAYEELVGQQRARLKRDPQDSEAMRDFLVGLVKLADLRRAKGELAELAAASSLLDEAAGVARSLLKLDASNAEAERDLLGILTRNGQALLKLGKRTPALKCFREAGSLTEGLLARREDPRRRKNLSAVWLQVANLARATGDHLGARTYLRKVVRNHQILAEQSEAHKPQLERLKLVLARQERHCALLTGEVKPQNAQEHLTVARTRTANGDGSTAVRHFRAALLDEEIRADPRHLYEAALAAGRAAAKAEGRAKRGFTEQGIAWLGEEVAARRAQLDQLEELLSNAPPQDKARLEDFRQGISAHLSELERGTEPALAPLRAHPGYRKLFPKSPR